VVVTLFSPLLAYAYGIVSGLALKFINVD